MAGNPSHQVLRQMHRLFRFGAVGTMSDAQLLDRFVARRDEAAEAAFEELVTRHAPMVLRVCRSVLDDGHNAEDAFQAVFLVLASRAGSIRRSESIASWLFGVARRVAARARRDAARRRMLVRRVAERTSETCPPAEDDSDWQILHEEIDGLPERLRSALVLCSLQGLTHAAAAQRLGVSEVAIRGRLARARQRLRQRLIRRGLTVLAGPLVVAASGQAESAVPVSLIHSTVRIALGFVAGHTAAILARGVLNSMLLYQLRVATVLLCLGIGGSCSAWHAFAAADEKGQTRPRQEAATVQLIPPPVRKNQKFPTVQLIRPPVRNIVRTIGQPSFIEASERTFIRLKPNVRVDKLLVELGDKVKKGDVLATLFVPEMVLEDYEAKRAAVDLDQEKVLLAHKLVNVAKADVRVAEARLEEAKAIFAKFEAEVIRWDSEVKRLRQEVRRGVVDPQVLVESANQLKASSAARHAAKATVKKVEAELSKLAKSERDVEAVEATLAVAQREEKRLEASVGRLPLIAPYDGVIVARNARPGEIYAIDKIDVVLVCVDIPEPDADYVHAGTKAPIVAKAFSDQPILATLSPSFAIRLRWASTAARRTRSGPHHRSGRLVTRAAPEARSTGCDL
jgi:RNA polymerase sigma factor (sigma-70 family)